MDKIIDKTYELLDAIESSELVKNLEKVKENLLKNKEFLKELENVRNIENCSELVEKKKKLYENEDYYLYNKYYNELHEIVIKINNEIKTLIDTRMCINENN